MPYKKVAICDRCGKEFTGTCYSLRVYAEDTAGGLTCEAASQNIRTNLAHDHIYCPVCMGELRTAFNF